MAERLQAHIAAAVASKPQLVQISTSYRAQAEGSTVLSRNKYVSIREEKPTDKEQAKQPEFKTCKDTLSAIIADGEGQGIMQKVCTNPICRVHHPKDEQRTQDEASRAKWKAEQEKQRREEAIANTTGLRVLSAIGSAVPVRLLKRDLLFIAERLLSLMDEPRIEALASQHGIRQKRDDGGIKKTLRDMQKRSSVTSAVILQTLRWLDEAPEAFLVPSLDGASRETRLPRAGLDEVLRLDTVALYSSLDARRQHLDLTWAQVAKGLPGFRPGMLSNLAKGPLIGFPRVMLLTQWLDLPLAHFVRARSR